MSLLLLIIVLLFVVGGLPTGATITTGMDRPESAASS